MDFSQNLNTKTKLMRQQWDEDSFCPEELKRQHDYLMSIAYKDSLTGLPNKASLYEDFPMIIKKEPDYKASLLFIDIDNFKNYNATMGHSFGDQLIISVGKRLSDLLGDKCTTYRFGGDEFVILISDINSINEIEEYVKRIMQSFRDPISVMDIMIHVSVSIGVAIYPDHGTSYDELLGCSDVAMYNAKEMGKNQCSIYNKNMQGIVSERMELEKYLRSAIEKGELELYYQPLVELATGKISGFEALLRWNSKELGFVSPLKFIKVAEESGLIIPIGEWVLRNACFFLKKLHSIGHGNINMAVNISIIQLMQDDFVQTILHLLDFINLKPQHLELEITESIFMKSYGLTNHKLEQLRQKGIKIALDDFGQGYSSLSKLHNLPIDTLKVDKVFVDGIISDKSSKAIAEMIIMMGHKIGLTVLAEGVETQEQMDYLTEHKCDKMQGYLFSKPIPEKEVLKLLEGKENTKGIASMWDWKVEYSVNIDEIDVQHKKLFEIGKRISSMVFLNTGIEHYQEISDILGELNQYVKYHFAYEENRMEKKGYVHFNTHKNEHDFIVKKLESLENTFTGDNQNEMLMEMIDFVFVWISNHILKEDMKYKDYI